MANSNQYMREYLKRRYHSRRQEAIESLGGRCVVCGTNQELEFDHKTPVNKTFSISRLWNVKKEKYIKEIRKCQLLCKKCHIKKTREERGQKNARETHGTLSSYRYCKCKLCKDANNKYMREYKRRVRSKTVTASAF